MGRDESLIVQELVEQGLLVHDETAGKQAVLSSTDKPTESLAGCVRAHKATVKVKDVKRFFSAALSAGIYLRFRSMENTVLRIVHRKRAGTKRNAADDDRSMAELVSVFRALRPFYAREYLCLFDSLALVKFLARYGFFPQWIFGVQLEPFAAHCWVQDGPLLLNETVEVARQYTPIMVV